jgi:hypothetical protein
MLPADSADPMEPADPIAAMEPADPTESIDPTEFSEPMLKALLVDAMEANESWDHKDQGELLGGAGSVLMVAPSSLTAISAGRTVLCTLSGLVIGLWPPRRPSSVPQ